MSDLLSSRAAEAGCSSMPTGAESRIEPLLRYPHENIEALPGGWVKPLTDSYQQMVILSGKLLAAVSVYGLRPALKPGIELLGYARNGPGTKELLDKERFAAIVSGLGYLAPRSVVVSSGDSSPETLEQIIALDPDRNERFCKPLWASQGRGALPVDSPEEALAFTARQRQKYLVQTSEIPEQDWRYVLHRGANELGPDDSPSWRIAYKKVRPIVVGDGKKSIASLVIADSEIPRSAKFKYMMHHLDELAQVPEGGECVELIKTGNISQGAYGQLPDEGERENLDRFMQGFYRALEGYLGRVLGTMCVDIGVKDSTVLQGEYDEAKLRENIVFYEFQMPFGMTGYLNQLPERRNWLIGKVFAGLVRRRFVNSMLATGSALRSRSR